MPLEIKTCGAKFELLNGETVTPCHLPYGHEGKHTGTCLGSEVRWPQGYSSQYELGMFRYEIPRMRDVILEACAEYGQFQATYLTCLRAVALRRRNNPPEPSATFWMCTASEQQQREAYDDAMAIIRVAEVQDDEN